MPKVLITLRHGLGDAVQLTIPLQHIQKYHPNWEVDVVSLYGKHSCYFELCNHSFIMRENEPNKRNYDKIFNLSWAEPMGYVAGNIPSTKPAISLKNEFRMEPDPDLFHYKINIPKKCKTLVKRYVGELPPNKGLIVIHYEGNSSPQKKNLTHGNIRKLSKHLTALGFLIVILDWDRRSPLPNENERIVCPGAKNSIWGKRGTGDAATIAALINEANLFIGIDSGPLHIAGATTTPAIGVWTNHHPAHFFDLAENVVHLLPRNSKHRIRGNNKDKTLKYFETNYRHVYHGDSLHQTLMQTTCDLLEMPNPLIAYKKSETVVLQRMEKELGMQKITTKIKPEHWWMLGPDPELVYVFKE